MAQVANSLKISLDRYMNMYMQEIKKVFVVQKKGLNFLSGASA